MRIAGASAYPDTPWPAAPPRAGPAGPPFVTSVSPNGRHFLDQYGQPILLKGDAPWSLLTDLSPAQAELYFSTREQQGFNAAIISLLGNPANGGPSEDGSTYDGIAPFVDGDVPRWNEPYWERVTPTCGWRPTTASPCCSTPSTAGPSGTRSSQRPSSSAGATAAGSQNGSPTCPTSCG